MSIGVILLLLFEEKIFQEFTDPSTIFLVAFFLKKIGGTAVFWSAIIAQTFIFALYLLRHRFPVLDISYLWYNLIGCAVCVGLSLALQAVLPANSRQVSACP